MVRSGVLALLLSAAAALPGLVAGQNGHVEAQARFDSLAALYPPEVSAAPAPFGPGERLTYKVKVGIFSVGEGSMTIADVDTVRGHETYVARMYIDGGLGPAKVHDAHESWFDVRNLVSWRFIQNIQEVNYKSFRHYEFYPERNTWERTDNGESGALGSTLPLDDIAFIYYVRTLPLEVGKTYTLNRYFKSEGNPVVVKVERRDERKTDAGRFKTIVVKPIIRTKGLFGQGGDAELHFTDDDRRILVYLKSNIPGFPGSLTLHLKKIEEGVPLQPAVRARFEARLTGEHAEPPDTASWP
ncbi:MAG: DUF3108 domain-containing protein [Gemmatimonadota bacterium]|jgi:hypothetical protein